MLKKKCYNCYKNRERERERAKKKRTDTVFHYSSLFCQSVRKGKEKTGLKGKVKKEGR